ncbi:MAG TPA: response regulator transcription factor [Pyrinomonadaceae bacterium]|jgi:DNA-binding response OmpR family regulator
MSESQEMSRVLIVEDERHLAEGLRFNLEAEGYRVDIANDGEVALERLTATPQQFDAVVLDVMLPGIDGFGVVSELRRAGQFIPVLMLTARGRPEDVLRGFEAGADDYLPKPFELAILIARLRGLLRRREWLNRDRANSSQGDGGANDAPDAADIAHAAVQNGSQTNATDEPFIFDGKTIDFGALELRTGNRTVRLTLMEVELLRYLIKHAGRAVSRRSVLEDVWGLHEDTDTRAIDNFIVRLRKYIEDEPSKPKHLLTVRSVGYRFIPEPDASDAE